MTIIRNLMLAAMLGAVATSTQAQTTETRRDDRLEVVVRQDDGMGPRSVLARELLDISVGPNFAKEIERAMIDQMGKVGEQGGEEAAWVRANMPPMLARMIDRMLDDMAPIYADIYTEDELRGQIAFYRSPVGQSVAAKAASLGLAVQESQAAVVLSFMTEFQTKYCAQFNCEGARTMTKPSRD